MKKRLFLFAAYDPDNMIGASLAYYLRSLAELGDVVLFMDNERPAEKELAKLSGIVKLFGAEKHGEYDFGSYKRAFKLAEQDLKLDGYDCCYLVNDSVFGPLMPMGPILDKLENSGAGAFGLVYNPKRREPHLQSWFVGFGKDVLHSPWFRNFIESVSVQADKIEVCRKYENGLTALFLANGIKLSSLYSLRGKAIYNRPEALFRKGLPFVKRNSFVRHNGSLCLQIRHILEACPEDCRDAIIQDCLRLYGKEYVNAILNAGRLEAFKRYIQYLRSKLS